MRTMRKNKHLAIGLAAGLLVLAFTSCNPLENESRSNTFIIVENILGRDLGGQAANFMQSDVVREGIVYADIAQATLRASLLDPAPLLPPSQYNDITLTRYVISYSRTDGMNRPGVDVPYSFEGSLSLLLRVGASTTVSFVIVREAAKLEPPLSNLWNRGWEEVLQVTARIDFYGEDVTRREVKATGYLPIFFANYADN